MADSPIQKLLDALDTLDVEQVMALTSPSASFRLMDGGSAEGSDGVRVLLAENMSQLRAARHRITAQWRQDDVWIAEVDATYELRDGAQTATLGRAFIAHFEPDGLTELHVYGDHEHPLHTDAGAQRGLVIGGHWIPPL